MDFDAVLESAGSFGLFQVKVIAVFYVAVMFCALPVQQDIFVAYTPQYRCRIPSCDSEDTSYKEPFLNWTTPYDDDHDQWESCSYFNPANASDSSGAGEPANLRAHATPSRLAEPSGNNSCNPMGFGTASTRDCDNGYEYSTEVFSSSAAIDFSLTCSRSYLASLLGSSYMLGSLVSSLFMGFVGDYFGRKMYKCLMSVFWMTKQSSKSRDELALMVSVLTMVTGGLVCALSPWYPLLIVMRFFTALGGNGIFQCAFIMSVEYVVPRHRVAVGIMINAPYALGGAVVSLLAYAIRDNWRLLQLLYTVPAVLLLGLYWVVPESVRWLIARGRHEEAAKVARNLAATNGRTLPQHLLIGGLSAVDGPERKSSKDQDQRKEEGTRKKKSVLDLLRYPNMRDRCLIQFFIWPSVTLVYYGVSLNSVNIGGNIFLNFLLSMVIEVPSYFFVWYTLDRLGRKGCLMSMLLLSGIACFVSGFLPEGSGTAVITLSLLGKFGAAGAFSIVYVYASEVFPTEYRSVGVGACSMCARVGGILAPLIAGLGRTYYQPLPLLVFGVLTITSGLLTLLLPETAGCKLPTTLQESERFASDQPISYFLCLDPRRSRARSNSSAGPLELSDGLKDGPEGRSLEESTGSPSIAEKESISITFKPK